jgi:hypothetical protein
MRRYKVEGTTTTTKEISCGKEISRSVFLRNAVRVEGML